MSVSVVIPSHNEGENLLGTVDSLLIGLPPDGEIVVVDDASTDGSAERLAAVAPATVRILRPTERLGAAGARNHGAIAASGDVLIFSDAHVQVPADWSSRLLPLLDQPGVGAAAPGISVMHAVEP